MADADLLREFVVDSLDLLDNAEPKLVEFQQACDATGQVESESINAVFRFFHTMKGIAGFLQLDNIAALTHEAETLLDLFRKGKALITSGHTELLFTAMDLIRKMLAQVDELHSDEGFEEQSQWLVGELSKAIRSETGEAPPAKAPAPSPEACAAAQGAPAAEEEGTVPGPPAKEEAEKEGEEELAFFLTEEMVGPFVQESDELLQQLEQSLLQVEGDRENAEAVGQAFRAIHSFKGNCGFMGLVDLERLSHKMEFMLEFMKEGTLEPNADNTGVLLNMIDVLREAVAEISHGGKGGIDNCDLYNQIMDDILGDLDEEDLPSPAPEAPPQAAPRMEGPSEPPPAPPEEVLSPQPSPPPPPPEPEPEPKPVERSPGPATGQAPQGAVPSPPPSPKEAKPKPPSMPPHPPGRAIARQDIRVDLRKLDALMNLVGELVIAEAMMTRHPAVAGLEDEGVERAVHQLRRVSQDLQDVAMSVRMVPLEATFQRMIRLVHDLSNKSGKKVHLQLLGEHTEVDKTIIEQVADPLVHIVRNAVDHGIEPPEKRVADGKAETGTLIIEGRHEGGEVWIIVKDDGQGLNPEKILAKAMDRGLVQGSGTELTEEQVCKLIFEPGFSTADKVTDISGRGVGMDVVKRNLEKLKGRVDVRNKPGQGAAFILRIPLTLAIIEGMLVRVGSARYTIPLLAIRESFRPSPDKITITPDGQEIVRVREEMLTVVRLHELFHQTPDFQNLDEGILMIVESEGHTVCLFVDEILGQQETVIKGLSNYLGSARGVSGCTILGNGEVSLILDVSFLIGAASLKEAV